MEFVLQVVDKRQNANYYKSSGISNRKFDISHSWVIAGFRSEVDENCALLGYYAASSGKFLADVSGQPPIFKEDSLKIGPIGCPQNVGEESKLLGT